MKNSAVIFSVFGAIWFFANSEAAEVEGIAEYEQSIAEWHAAREARLKGPAGWLNLAGLYWLDEGINGVGSAADSDILLPDETAPEHVGVFVLEDGEVDFRAAPGVDVFSGDERVTQLDLLHDEAGEPTILTSGRYAWYAIRRMERMGVRLRDYEHPVLSTFPGIETYPVGMPWRVNAEFKAYPEPRQIVVTTVVEGLGWDPIAPGVLEFELEGEQLSLEAYQSGDALFLIFADLTTGDETYPAGRYLYVEAPGPDGTTVLDFNKAYNPPCAFNEFATCPLPTRRNYLQVRIEAGEKYSEGLHASGI